MSERTVGLVQRHCVPCEGGEKPLSAAQYQPILDLVEGWHVEAGKQLVKSFKFGNFVVAVDFVNAITPIAEAEGHHPDLMVKWGEVGVTLWTHAIGGLSENDFILAAKIDEAARRR